MESASAGTHSPARAWYGAARCSLMMRNANTPQEASRLVGMNYGRASFAPCSHL